MQHFNCLISIITVVEVKPLRYDILDCLPTVVFKLSTLALKITRSQAAYADVSEVHVHPVLFFPLINSRFVKLKIEHNSKVRLLN